MQIHEKKMLPLAPIIEATYSSNSHLFSVILQSPNGYAWIMNHYIQLWCSGYGSKNRDMVLNFIPLSNPCHSWDKCEYIKHQRIDLTFMMNHWQSIVDFTIDSINGGWYVYMLLDQYFIPESELGDGTHFAHKNFFYGYEKTKKLFYIADHFDEGKYGFKTVGFSNMLKAFDSVTKGAEYRAFRQSSKDSFYLHSFRDLCYLIKLNDHDYSFNKQLLEDYLSDYFYSTNRFQFYHHYSFNKMIYGLDTYACLIEYINDTHDTNIDSIDYRIFTMLKDHKNLMLLRLAYLKANHYKDRHSQLEKVIVMYKDILTKSNMILNLILKLNFSKNMTIIQHIIKHLTHMRQIEKKALESFIEIVS
ncbi:MAG: hypothetical protein MJB12_05785 [Firmicutes bacterium]|nr:hypothetical protein [Bacillota bacterium]